MEVRLVVEAATEREPVVKMPVILQGSSVMAAMALELTVWASMVRWGTEVASATILAATVVNVAVAMGALEKTLQ